MADNNLLNVEYVGDIKQNEINVYLGGKNENIAKGFKFGPFIRDFYDIEYCLQGGYTLFVNDVPHEIHEGGLYIAAPYTKLEKHFTADCTSSVWVATKGFRLKKYFETLGFSDTSVVFPHKLSEKCVGYLEELVNSFESHTVFSFGGDARQELFSIQNTEYSDNYNMENDLRQSGLFSLFLAELMNAGGSNDGGGKTSHARKYIDEAVRYIQANYQLNITVESLSHHIGIDRTYLFMLFRKEFGMSVRDYLKKTRMSVACDLLKLGDVPIKTVAASVGYEQLAFSRIFKKTVGVSPTEYRNRESKK